MNCVCKYNKELSYEDVMHLYEIFENNMKKISEGSIYSRIFNDSYKEKWISDTINDDNIKILLYYDDNKLVGYIFAIDQPNENFIREFQICEEYQSDGSTFKSMINMALPHLDSAKDFAGNIWMINKHAQKVFSHIGVRYKDDKFFITVDKLKQWLNA